MIKNNEVYKVGKLGKPHGVKGEITFAFDDDVFDRVDADYLILDIDGILVPFFIDDYRFKNNDTALMKFEDIDTQDKAQELTGCDVYFPYKLSDSDEENISWSEITGFTLVDYTTGKTVGIIRNVDDSTINLLFEIETNDGKEALIPANNDLIKGVDIKNKEIKYDLPDGLLDLD